ncbi:2-dehydro-3-deoxygluconokinase [Intestinibacter bartlettii DSM 16795]|uniref:sugar kinase n=1 Tax=Intestinibacter bartlettii TaxID=261299 RepID=UPI00030C106F|nr:sugar kinase [Intestinibacter bartlettii]UWO81572.1 sugar kinase [Intestinibacter bartlettii]SKA55815.1 2-dehydro-3-deoxygluconokinase [Intestinibacter bartlettii DSM 16795]
MKVAGFGEIMLRLSTDVGKMILQSDRFNVNYGGGEANVLISLSHFGIDTKMITSVSNDDIGKSILRYLRSYDIDTEFVTLSDHRTGIYYLQVGSGIRSSKVIYDRDNSAFCNMKVGDIDIAKALEDVDVFYFSGITLALSNDLRELLMQMLTYCKEHNIMVSYDSNYRAKLWSLEEAREATLKVLPYVDILSAGILDAENILLMNCELEDNHEKLKYYYDEITKTYPNIKHIFSSHRDIESSSVNKLQCNYYTDGILYLSNKINIDSIVDRVGGGDALSAGIIYSIINNKDPKYVCEFATCASALKHSILGDANLVELSDVERLMYEGVGKIAR